MPNLTQAQIDQLRSFRGLDDETTRKRRKAALFAEVKSELRIPKATKLRVEIDNTYADDYAALKDASTGRLLAPVQDYKGPRVLNRITPVAAPAEERWKISPGTAASPPPRATPVERAVNVLPPFNGITRDQPNFDRPVVARPEPSVPALKLGSLSLEDAMALLRIEGDTRESYSTTSEQTLTPVFIRGDRLYFVL